jgi:hypothetical protein
MSVHGITVKIILVFLLLFLLISRVQFQKMANVLNHIHCAGHGKLKKQCFLCSFEMNNDNSKYFLWITFKNMIF